MVAVLTVRIADPSKIVTGFNRCVFSLRPKTTKPPHLTGGVQMRRLYCLAGATFREEVAVLLINWCGGGTLPGETAPHVSKLHWVDAVLYCQIFSGLLQFLQHGSGSVSRDAGIDIAISGNIPRPDINRHKGVFTCPCGMRQAGRVIRPLS